MADQKAYGYDLDGDGEGEAVQQGGDRQNIDRTSDILSSEQGEKTRAANRDLTSSGSPDQGAQ